MLIGGNKNSALFKAIVFLIATIGLVIFIPLINSVDLLGIILLTVIYYSFITALLNHKLGLFLLILIRPLLDVFT